MDVKEYYRSLTTQLECLKDRVWNFIENAHHLTSGEWKEGVLRSMLAPRLPETVKIGRGFVLTDRGPTTQCDVVLYKANSPVVFRDGDLVILTPDAVLGIIEVKTRATRANVTAALEKFSDIGQKIARERSLFAYESDLHSDQAVVDMISEKCDHAAAIVDFVNLGCSTFIKWWMVHPNDAAREYNTWHAYSLERMSAGYFMANIVDFVSPESVQRNNLLWFPEDGKELKKTAAAPFHPRR